MPWAHPPKARACDYRTHSRFPCYKPFSNPHSYSRRFQPEVMSVAELLWTNVSKLRNWRFLTIRRRQIHLVAEEIQKQERADSTAAIAGAPRSHNVRRDAHASLADYFQHFNQCDSLSAERIDLFVIGDALRLTHHAPLLGLS